MLFLERLYAKGWLAYMDGLLTAEACTSFADEKSKDTFSVISRVEGFVWQRK